MYLAATDTFDQSISPDEYFSLGPDEIMADYSSQRHADIFLRRQLTREAIEVSKREDAEARRDCIANIRSKLTAQGPQQAARIAMTSWQEHCRGTSDVKKRKRE
jgi:hypothetical protein